MYNEYPEYPEITKIVLQKIRVAVSRAWSSRELSHLPVELYDYMIRQESERLVCRLEATLLGLEADPIVIEYPDGWWEAFKQRWFPWLEIRKIRHDIRASQLFPRQAFEDHLGESTYTLHHWSGRYPVRRQT